MIIISAAILLSGIFFITRNSAKNKTIAERGTNKKEYMLLTETEIVVGRLEALGYYKYADTQNVDMLKMDLVESIAEYGILSSVDDPKTLRALDYRNYSFDGETLFEEGGFADKLY